MAYAYMKENTTDPNRAPYKVTWKLPARAANGVSRSDERTSRERSSANARTRSRDGRKRAPPAQKNPPPGSRGGGSPELDRPPRGFAHAVHGRGRESDPPVSRRPNARRDRRRRPPDVGPGDQASRERGTGGPLAPASVHKAINALSRLLDDAVPKRLDANPLADRTSLRIPPVEDAGRESLTPDEVEKLANELPDEYRAIAWVGATAGLRIGELLALRWRDVDLDRGTVRVVRSVTESSGRLTAQSYGKTSNAFRTVPIPARTVQRAPGSPRLDGPRVDVARVRRGERRDLPSRTVPLPRVR